MKYTCKRHAGKAILFSVNTKEIIGYYGRLFMWLSAVITKQTAEVIWRMSNRIRGRNMVRPSTTMFLLSPVVFTPNSSSIHPAVFAGRRRVTDRFTNTPLYGNISRNKPHLMHLMQLKYQPIQYRQSIRESTEVCSASNIVQKKRRFHTRLHSICVSTTSRWCSSRHLEQSQSETSTKPRSVWRNTPLASCERCIR